MKRKQTEIEVRLRSTLPYILMGKSNKDYYLSLYFIEDNKMVCKTSVRSYYRKEVGKDKTLIDLVGAFANKVKDILKGETANLRILRRRITTKFYGKELIRLMEANGISLNQNINIKE